MKQHLSVFMLAARSSIYKVVGLIVCMALVESAAFSLTLFRMQPDMPLSLAELFVQSRIPLIFGIFFFLLCVILSLTGCEYSGSKLRYTLQRLYVSEKCTVIWCAVYNILCFFIFWALQALLAFLLCQLYLIKIDTTYINEQTVFLAFYQSSFLHSLLPLAETNRYIRNFVLVGGLGITTASYSFKMRHDLRGLSIWILAALVFVSFVQPIGIATDIVSIFCTLLISGTSLVGIWKDGNNED